MLKEGIDYYIDNGMYVFTKEYHLKRGYCCKSGCRHCPWEYKKKTQAKADDENKSASKN